ncbi:MAG: insulinase family protein [Bacteroidetes bacterium]|nr:insulinase family protein [Bacteroidota bacterium]
MRLKKLTLKRFLFATLNLFSLGLLMTLLMSATPEVNYPGYKLLEKRFVKELNANVFFLEHVKSGAKIVKFATDDANKTFTIAFKTFPDNDCGAPHIIEHTVLNGSTNYPVKSPFDVLIKGSLHTYMNAFTSKDFTAYPVASMNDKDYFNLMHVYLDAVFNPLIYTDPRIFKQEGWHFELLDKDSAVAYKGVVYNEMKGAFSDPREELSYQVYKNMFPDNAYGKESGGYPYAIPQLSYEQFLNFHRKFYHPENSYIFLYGDAPLDKELAFIDREYLSKYDKANNKASITDQKPFAKMMDLTGYYPIMPGDDSNKQTYLSLNYVTGHNTDEALVMALDVLTEVLVNQESAPIRLALQEAGIGQDVSASSSNYKQNVVQIMVQNANPGDKDKFNEIVRKCMQEAVDKGLDKQVVEGVINRMEFQLREGNDAQKGMYCVFRSLPTSFFADDPFLGLEYEKPLSEVKKSLTTRYLEEIIKTSFLDNPHTLLYTLAPKVGADDEKNAKVAAELKAYKASLNPAKTEALVQDTKALLDYQKSEDSPEALAKIPLLEIKDINPKATFYSVEESKIAGTPMLYHNEFTNGVVYMNLYFDLRVLPQDMIPYASLLSNVLSLLNTEKYSFGDLNKSLNINTGGFYTSLKTYQENLDDNAMIPKLAVTSKAMTEKVEKMIDLTSEILLQTKYDDVERLKNVLTRHLSQLEATTKQDGYTIASGRFPSYFSKSGVYSEMTNGLNYYWFVADLMKNYDTHSGELIANLKKVAALLFTKNNLVSGVTTNKEAFAKFTSGLERLVKALPDVPSVVKTWDLAPQPKNEGFLTPSKVQYVIAGFDYKQLGYKWDGKMRVLSQILSTDYLQTRVRVMGGAYGGWSSISPIGNITFNSYRDPNLKQTLENYKGIPEYLKSFDADDKAMTRYILGTVSSLDRPLTASQKGDQAFSYFFNKRTEQAIQDDRVAVISTKAADIKSFARMIQDVLDKNEFCVYGNADKINAEKALFQNLVNIQK